ncbi:MAG: hypothetical protein ACFE8Z_03875 [Candidatus Hermodarchaeota archaeon]
MTGSSVPPLTGKLLKIVLKKTFNDHIVVIVASEPRNLADRLPVSEANHHQYRLNAELVSCTSVVDVFLAGSTYPTLYGAWYEFLRIPVPNGPFLVYFTAKYVEQAPPIVKHGLRRSCFYAW